MSEKSLAGLSARQWQSSEIAVGKVTAIAIAFLIWNLAAVVKMLCACVLP